MSGNDKLYQAIQTIEDFIINARGGEKIIFTIAEDWDETNNLPVIDYSLQDKDGLEIEGDLNFDTLGEALISLADSLAEGE